MTEFQITKYEYCKEHLNLLEKWKKNLPFSIQQYGCGSGQPSVEFALEEIHRDMFTNIRDLMDGATVKIQEMIDQI